MSGWFAVGVCLTMMLCDPVVAHAGAIRPSDEPVTVPQWLLLSTGGGVVFSSFLLTATVTDREFLCWFSRRSLRYRFPDWLRWLGRRVGWLSVGWLSVGWLIVLLVVGLVGPVSPLSSLTILFVWVGWWAGYTISVYTFTNSWPQFNPWRTIVDALDVDGRRRQIPPIVERWAAVCGLLGLVFLEVVTPLATDPRLLSAVIIGYSVLTVGGGWLFGSRWFERVDPISRVFRAYGSVAPFHIANGTLTIRSPASDLVRWGDVRFVIAILWATTYDGLTGTELWATVVRSMVSGPGVAALLVYLLALGGGYLLFLFVYRAAVRYTRRTGPTFVTTAVIADRFVPSLLAIAASYHLAHYLGYLLELLPVLLVAIVQPLGGPMVPVRLVPGPWIGGLQLLLVLFGHIVAVWVAHASAFELFTGTLQPLRIQYPLVVTMMAYTVVSMWIVLQPYAAPPFVS
ncbi:hypothetical protein [Halocatena halophila]|uniref:hypothetical protein n=1 Tax=Halocatena halophila TaxID=2814576 RepID=UPI002ED3D5A3